MRGRRSARSWPGWPLAALLPLLPLAAAVQSAADAAAAASKQQASPPGILELTDDTFKSGLSELPEDRWVLMEFYAHWCPHCQHFKPEYEKVAKYFHERGDQEPVVVVARIDCANNNKMCSHFKVHGYPTLKLGLAGDMAAEALDKMTDVQPASRHADSVVAFLGSHLNVKFDVDSLTSDAAVAAKGAGGLSSRKAGAGLVVGAAGGGSRGKADGSGAKAAAAPAVQQQVDLVDVEGATITSWQYLAASPVLLKGPEARQALKDWVDLLAETHPVERCRRGAEKAQEALDELWPDDQDEPEKGLQNLRLCQGTHFKEWRTCRSTKPDARGYTCGLWQLFHTMASRLPDTENAGAVWMAAVKGFVKNYFQCSECAKHFVRHAGGEEAAAVARKRDAVLWMWHTHNIVNRRLGALEKADPSKGDPSSPHVQFPPATLCSKCRKAEGVGVSKDEAVPWDEEEVYKFLLAYYSGEQPAAGNGSNSSGGGGGSRRASWSDAGLLMCVVAACVYGVLRRSGQYALRKSDSRSL